MKRLLFEVHRWLGIVLAVFMLIWFFSGLLIIYAGSATTSRVQQLARAETLVPETGWLSLGEAWQRSAEERKALSRKGRAEGEARSGERNPEEARAAGGERAARGTGGNVVVEARLLRQDSEPFWLVEDGRGQRFSISAADGHLRTTSPERAVRLAKHWLDASGSGAASQTVRYLETFERDSSVRNLDALKPFHRLAVDGATGRELVISGRTGEVVRDSTVLDRALYWGGNWLHMFRPLDALGWGDIRRDMLTWVSGGALIAVITGLIIGWLRWRPGWLGKPTYSEGRKQPYRAFWLRWHFWSGLIGGILTLTWALSGFLNNNPRQLFSAANASREDSARYLGSGLPKSMAQWQPAALVDAGAEIVELSWRHLGDDAVLLGHTRDGRRLPQPALSGTSPLAESALLAAVGRLAGDVPIASHVVQNEYDSYYYPSHRRGTAERPLPIVRIELADAGATRFYVDPLDGRLLLRQDQSRRVFRWLFSALHHWDIGWLYQRPLWDVWMVIWSLFGLVLSVTSVVIGWKRLGRTFRFGKPVARNKVPAPVLAGENQAG